MMMVMFEESCFLSIKNQLCVLERRLYLLLFKLVISMRYNPNIQGSLLRLQHIFKSAVTLHWFPTVEAAEFC